MAPIKASRRKSTSSKGSKGPNKSSTFRSNTEGRVSKTARPKAPQPKQQKTKSNTSPVKKKKRVYTDKELGVPKLNMITPVGVDQPKGKKKGRVFVDDQVSLQGFIHSFTTVSISTHLRFKFVGEYDDNTRYRQRK